MRNHYSMRVHWSLNDQCYVSEVPALPGCMSDGKTLEELFRNTDRIIDEWIATAKGDKLVIPKEDGKVTDNPLDNVIPSNLKEAV